MLEPLEFSDVEYWQGQAHYVSKKLSQVRKEANRLAWACMLLAVWAVWATVWSVLSQ